MSRTITEILSHRAVAQADRLAYTFLADDNIVVGSLTYAELDTAARNLAAQLRLKGQAGDRVLILLPAGLDFIISFMGCLYARMIAVPCPPPEASRLKRTLPRLRAIAIDAGATELIANQRVLDILEENRAGLHIFEDMRQIAMDGKELTPSDWALEENSLEAPAFLQYTSGSTSTPKGVVITHRNLVHNSEYINQSGRYTEDKVTCTWMPHFHDYGLIDGLLQPLYAGIPCYFMSPMSFLKRPLRWLQAISTYRVTHSHAPNFAFEYCVDRIPEEQRVGLDLSCWLAASNAAEPVRAETLSKFVDAFGPYGFREETFCPTYGLAEATLLVSTGPYGGKPVRLRLDANQMKQNQIVPATKRSTNSISLVGVGQAVGEMKLRIVDTDRLCLADENQVGEIWLSDPSMATGYWNKPEENLLFFNAYLSDTGEGPFLRTGDLGFIYQNELFIAGRLKDLIIIMGRNHYPHDIEETVTLSHEDLSTNLAAFTVDRGGEERLVIVAELDRRAQKRLDLEKLVTVVSAALWESHDLLLDTLVLLKPGSLPKTSSGKVQRRGCKAAFIENSLEVIETWSRPAPSERTFILPQNEEQVMLKGIWEDVLGHKQVGIDDHFLELGGHSLLAARMAAQVRILFGVELQPSDIFSAPTIRQMAVLLSELESSPLVSLPAVTPLSAEEREGHAPLSFAQQRLWFLYRMEGGGPTYNIAAARVVLGYLDLRGLQRSFAQILQRHEILRTRFVESDGVAHQLVEPFQGFDLWVWDLSDLELAEANRAAKTLINRHALITFDLERGPLLQFQVIRKAVDEHLLLFNIHHIISDGWSMDIMIKELTDFYHGYCREDATHLPALAIQYIDFAHWQRTWLQGPNLEAQLQFWRQELEGAPHLLNLPLKAPRPLHQTFEGQVERFKVEEPLASALSQVALQNHATLYHILAAAFAELLSRYCGTYDLNIGTPVANRRYAELEPLIGFFVNTLVLRHRLKKNATVRERITELRDLSLNAFSNQDLPFEKLVEELNPVRDPGCSPLFQVMFNFLSFGTGVLTFDGANILPVTQEHVFAKFDVTLIVTETRLGLEGELEYNKDLFDPIMIQNMVRHYQSLLKAFVSESQVPVARLFMLDEQQRAELIRSSYGKELDIPDHGSILTGFRNQVSARPDQVAVVFGETQYSYAQLDQSSNRLAQRLRHKGVGPESLVGICCERSAEMVVGLLAILKAGGAYLPLDPDFPQERLQYYLEDSGAQLLLGDHSMDGRFDQFSGTRQRLTDPSLANESTAALPESAGLVNRLYLIYTSGSTGRPKGVTICHGSFLNLLAAMSLEPGFGAQDILLAVVTLSFDMAGFEIWLPLWNGGRIVVADKATTADGTLLAKLLETSAATVLQATPVTWQLLLASGWQATRPLKKITGGEPLTSALAAALLERPGQLWNAYGPTEITIYASLAQVQQSEGIVIGRPFANAMGYIVDRSAQLVPQGVPGELWVGGIGLGRGYHNRPAQTASSFVPDPFSNIAGARLYRSGDLTLYLADGSIRMLGRIDHQVKIRGFRIELGEIETRLEDRPNVIRALVLVEGKADHQRLVAFVQLGEDSVQNGVDGSEITRQLKSSLETSLPGYMVPSLIKLIPEWPLLPNGKVDRPTLLRMLDGVKATGVTPPATAQEALLCQIWADVLHLDQAQIGTDVSFFELGGHSLLATRLTAQVRQIFKVELALKDIFAHPTIQALAANLPVGDSQMLVPAPVRVAEGPVQPMSYAQSRLWFLYRLEGPSAIYNMASSYAVEGQLDAPTLEQSFVRLFARHEILRTSFGERDDRSWQIIAPELTFRLPVIDLSELETAQAEAAVSRLIRQEAKKPFILEQAPLLRCYVFRLSGSRLVLHIDMHHIISDGWSIGIFVKEILASYHQLLGSVGAAAKPLPELAVQYADYAIWQHEVLQAAMEQQEDYWVKTLITAPFSLDLPTIGARPSVQTFRGKRVRFVLDSALTQVAESFARQTRSTLFMVLEAVFAEIVGRYSGARDMLIGTPVANRRYSELEPLIGIFVNTLVLRNQLFDYEDAEMRMTEVREMALGAFANQDLPFERLVELLNPARDLSRSPLFQVMFILQNNAMSTLAMAGASLTPLVSDEEVAKFDLTLSLIQRGDELAAELEYNADLFSPTLMEGLAGNYRTLLRAFCEIPLPVARLQMLDEAQRSRLIQSSYGHQLDLPEHSSILTGFHNQVLARPDQIAVVFGETHYTYAQLDQSANQLAQRLRKQGVGPESLVGFCCERSAEMVVGLLAILKAGGAYLPLDPDFPQDRLQYYLEDSGSRLLLGDHSMEGRFSDFKGQRQRVDETSLANESTEPLPESAGLNNLLYMIYTSGSTGRPKGVAICHGSFLNLLAAMSLEPGFGPQDVLLAVVTLSFDMAGFEIWLPLWNGGRIVIAEKAVTADGAQLAKLLETSAATVLQATPVTWQLLLASGWRQNRPLKKITGGEPLTSALAAALLERPGQLWNAYGPTEITIYATLAHVQQAEGIVIGRPFTNAMVYIINRSGQLVPEGVPGELWVGGIGLGRGYHNRPALTATAFVPDPFSNQPGARLYRSGDLTFYLADGNIRMLGRIDHQVKIRGFRIELGEIEARLEAWPTLVRALVLVEGQSDHQRLVAFVQMSPGTNQDGESSDLIKRQLLGYLERSLPSYMVPKHIQLLQEWPLLPNGKVDRPALLRLLEAVKPTRLTLPATAQEALLCQIWADVLHLDQAHIGTDVSFFDLGGHSLLATRLTAQVRQVFKVELALKDVFTHPTIQALAANLPAANTLMLVSAPVRLAEGPVQPMSYAQLRLWFLYQLDGPSPTYNMFSAFNISGLLDVSAFNQAFGQLVLRHDILRTRFEEGSDGPVQIVQATSPFELAVVKLAHLSDAEAEAEVRRLVQAEANYCFRLEKDQLLRVQLCVLSERKFVMLLNMHHIISDGWSLGILVKEVLGAYDGLRLGQDVAAPSLAIQYADYAIWQKQLFSGSFLEVQLAYWKNQLEGAATVLDLPNKGPRPISQTFEGRLVPFELGEDLTQKVKELAQRNGITMFMVLEAVFAEVLGRYSGARDLLVGTPVANRRFAELEPLIGFFVNTLVLRHRLNPAERVVERLAAARETALEAYAHQDVPFERLVEVVNPARDMSRSPLFQVMFSLQNNDMGQLSTEDLRFDAIESDQVLAKFDLSLNLDEEGGRLRGSVEYNSDLFHDSLIRRFSHHYQVLLSAFASGETQVASRLSMLSEAEKRQLISDWNQTSVSYETQLSIWDRFMIWVERTPEAPCLLVEDLKTLSYAEMWEESRRLAAVLYQHGCGAERRVAVAMDRDADLGIALLAILQTGSVFVPLESNLPSSRIRYILEDSGCSLLLTTREVLAAKELAVPGLATVCMEDPRPEFGLAQQAARPELDHAVYIIYTSGSTGNPKGVVIPHRGLLHRLLDPGGRLSIQPGSRYLVISSIGFDPFPEQMLNPMIRGGAAVLICKPAEIEPLRFWGLMEQQRWDVLDLVPSMMMHFLSELPAQKPSHRPKLLILGGEAFPAELFHKLKAVDMFGSIGNAYGPTEVTIDALYYRVSLDHDTTPIPIGNAIPNHKAFILDDQLALLPVLLPGELCLQGVGVARGYLNRPGLTADRFIPNPYASEPGDRIYRTGDKASWLENGMVAYHGRIDHQVKLRGVRIELGEIEAVLRTAEGIEETVVLLEPKSSSLFAFIRTGAQPPEMETLKAHLAQSLPAFLIPSRIIPVERFPITTNGKLDQKELLSLASSTTMDACADAAPKTETEQAMALIWSQLLDLPIDKIGSRSTFFELGGHSLLATRLITQIRRQFNIEIELRQVFQDPTLAGMAAHLLQPKDPRSSGLGSILARPAGVAAPMALAQQRLWLAHSVSTDKSAYNIGITFRVQGQLDVLILQQVFHEISRRHETLRSKFKIDDQDVPYLEISPAITLPMVVVDLFGLTDPLAKAKSFAVKETSHAFDLAEDALLRIKLLRVSPTDFVISLTCPHIISDGWSLGILFQEVAELYQAFSQGEPSPLPELPIRYSDYAYWQRNYLTGQAYRKQQDYWRSKLSGELPILELPLDRPRQEVPGQAAGLVNLQFPLELATQLREFCQAHNLTMNMLLKAAYLVLLHRFKRQERIILGMVVAGRHHWETEGLIGCLLNILVMDLDLKGNPTFAELTQRVKSGFLDAYENQEVGFDELLRELQPPRQRGISPIFQATFGVQNTPMGEHAFKGMLLEPLETGEPLARYDLTLWISESNSQLSAKWTYRKELFDGKTIEEMATRYLSVLERAMAQPDLRIFELTKEPEGDKGQGMDKVKASLTSKLSKIGRRGV